MDPLNRGSDVGCHKIMIDFLVRRPDEHISLLRLRSGLRDGINVGLCKFIQGGSAGPG